MNTHEDSTAAAEVQTPSYTVDDIISDTHHLWTADRREGAHMSVNPYDEGVFWQVSDMENPLSTAIDLLAGIAFIAETLDEAGGPIQRIAWLASGAVKEGEELRGQLFKLTHPRRDHFEKEGWPA